VSKKTVCEIPSRWSSADYAQHSCTDRSHRHITRSQASEDVSSGMAEWIRAPRDRRGRMVVRVVVRNISFRGLSSSTGFYLRIAIAAKEDWAITMLRTIQMRREEPSISHFHA
jgi:hypothetical protein